MLFPLLYLSGGLCPCWTLFAHSGYTGLCCMFVPGKTPSAVRRGGENPLVGRRSAVAGTRSCGTRSGDEILDALSSVKEFAVKRAPDHEEIVPCTLKDLQRPGWKICPRSSIWLLLLWVIPAPSLSTTTTAGARLRDSVLGISTAGLMLVRVSLI